MNHISYIQFSKEESNDPVEHVKDLEVQMCRCKIFLAGLGILEVRLLKVETHDLGMPCLETGHSSLLTACYTSREHT